MLVISQKKDGRVHLYYNGAYLGSITNLGDKAKLGFSLPENVKILREPLAINDSRK